jgi:hypothetical protein
MKFIIAAFTLILSTACAMPITDVQVRVQVQSKTGATPDILVEQAKSFQKVQCASMVIRMHEESRCVSGWFAGALRSKRTRP